TAARRMPARGTQSMEDSNEETTAPAQKETSYELKGKVDTVSVLYVVGGIPCMIAFFLILFSLVNACDSVNTYIPA
ncbi:MAG: hypothetical protein ACKVK6_04290, partial [bacterium]